MDPFVEHLIVDSTGFIKCEKLEQIGKQIYTIREVVDEIKDRATKERLQLLPYELFYLNPNVEDIKLVTEFAKKTGDYSSLSATDLRLISAVYSLESKFLGTDHLKTTPQIVKTVKTPANQNAERPVGFYLPPKIDKLLEEDIRELNIEDKCNESNLKETVESESESESSSITDDDEEQFSGKEDVVNDDDGWITPNNIRAIKSTELANRQRTTVGCLSSDFAIQNVLMHMGLNVVSIDGVLVKRLKTWILRCYACLKTTSVMDKRFCPSCGNDTLKRVSVSVNEDGSMEYYISKRRSINTKGMNASIPMHKGGKHSNNPLLFEDQPIPENRLSKKALQKLNVLDSEYLARDSPFLTKDVYSRSALIGARKLDANKTKKRNKKR